MVIIVTLLIILKIAIVIYCNGYNAYGYNPYDFNGYNAYGYNDNNTKNNS